MISFVIPHYNSVEGLALLLDSIDHELAKLDSREGFEVIVVDDASSVGQSRLTECLKKFPAVKLVVNVKNRGPAFSRNQGARAAKGEWLWFVDSDVTLREGALEAMLALLRSQAGIEGVVSGVALDCASPRPFARYKNYLEFAWQPPEGETRTVDSKSFAAKRSAFLEVGGFDENRVGAGVEDYELGYRMRSRGHRLYFSHQIRITHAHAGFFKQARLFFSRARDWVALKPAYGLGFDDNGSTASEGLLQVIGVGILASLALSIRWPSLLLAAAGLSTAWAVLDLKKLKLLKQAGEKPGFFALHVAYSWLLSAPVVAGVSAGLLGLLKTAGRGVTKK